MGKNNRTRYSYVSPSFRAGMDSVVFCCFTIAGAIFIRSHLHKPSEASTSNSTSFLFNSSLRSEDVPVVAVYFGLA